ncbi:LysR family transcriptional regulator [Nocardiopsis sp. CC223A]|uniref:LysR family transcriptional regulator n=1 Tax=Nocardiopsis sp. CC223A TaxID=3044051 RepID=UPI00278C68B2|nr:LysR family transcriptional regulator [Nocardiopsis sp. CC223A]
MAVDPARVRVFVLAADEFHFGRVAGTLSVSQQALSKRIARLESVLGSPRRGGASANRSGGP